MKPNMQRLWKQLTQAANALAYADAGEFMPLDEKKAVLGVTPAEPPPQVTRPSPTVEPRRRVALAAEKGLGAATLRYALDVCARLDADLEVLAGPGVAELSQRIDLVRQGRDVNYHVLRLGKDFLADVTRYAWNTPSLLFVVTGAGDGLAERATNPDAGRLGIPSQVPWVVVAEGRNAA